MKRVQKWFYETSDGTEYESSEDALRHERIDKLEDMLERRGTIGGDSSYGVRHEAANCILEGFDEIKKIMTDTAEAAAKAERDSDAS